MCKLGKGAEGKLKALQKPGVCEAVPPFPPSRWKTERLNEKTTDPVFIVLGCEKHVQLLICSYLAVLCDIMLRAPLSSIVNSILLHNALFHAQPDKVWVES